MSTISWIYCKYHAIDNLVAQSRTQFGIGRWGVIVFHNSTRKTNCIAKLQRYIVNWGILFFKKMRIPFLLGNSSTTLHIDIPIWEMIAKSVYLCNLPTIFIPGTLGLHCITFRVYKHVIIYSFNIQRSTFY